MERRSLLLLTLLIVTPHLFYSHSAVDDPCDQYGDCTSSSISYVRSNPDFSLYPGDEFLISLNVVKGANTIVYSVSWSYDTAVFSKTGTRFAVAGNQSGTYTITAAVTLTGFVKVGNTTRPFTSTLSTSQTVTVIPMQLSFSTELLNVTSKAGNTLRNPDGSFYPFDEFWIAWKTSFKFSDVRKDITITVTSTSTAVTNMALVGSATDPLGRYGAFRYSIRNGSSFASSYPIVLDAYALNFQQFSLAHAASLQRFVAVPFVLTFNSRLVNSTDSYGFTLRNPDGSFYWNDSFYDAFNATFKFQSARRDITLNVTSLMPNSLRLLNASAWTNSASGKFRYSVGIDSTFKSYVLTLRARAFSWNGTDLGLRIDTQPFATVRYKPYFTYLTYMLYNSRNSSTYERPFVTLVRYGGNSPGYAYGGDGNTGAFRADNSTGERAWINNFTFSTDGWKVLFVPGSPDIKDNLHFVSYANLNVTVSSVNATALKKLDKPLPMITWHNRVQKYYFNASVTDLRDYLGKGVIYFNATEHAYSKNFAGGTYPLFNTSYLYEPIYYSGYLVFKAFDRSGNPDSQLNFTLTALNPRPLNPYLIEKVQRTFGNDSQVLLAFKRDLYSAYNTSQSLKPMIKSPGTWIYLVNQTNLANANSTALPYLTAEVTGRGLTFLYTFDNTFSAFQLGNESLPSLPFPNATNYYLDQGRQLLAQPLNFSFSSRMPFVEWSYNTSIPSFFSPVSYEPGNLTRFYPFPYGRNTTVYVNLDGGGAYLFSREQIGTNYRTTIYVAPQSGGATEVWARDSDGTLLESDALPDNSLPPQPQGFFGAYTFTFPLDRNGTVSIGITNSWGVSSVIGSAQVTVHVPSPPKFPEVLVWLFVIIIVMFYFIGRAMNRRSS